MKGRCLSGPLARGRAERPRLGQRTLVEVPADGQGGALAGVVVDPGPDRGGAFSGSGRRGELDDATRAEDPGDLDQGGLGIADVHEAHRRRSRHEGEAGANGSTAPSPTRYRMLR